MRRKKLAYGALFLLVLLIITAGLLLHNANRLIKYELRQYLGRGFTVEDISVRWGRVTARDIRLERPDGREAFSAKDLGVRANFIGLLKRENIISEITLDSPYLLLEVDKKGELVQPLPRRDKAAGQKKTQKPPGQDPPVLIKRLKVKEGSLDYLDRKVSAAPAPIKMREVRVDMKNFTVPPDSRISNYEFDAVIPAGTQKGTLSSMGALNLRTKDTKSRVRVRDMDITQLRPYFEKKGDVQVTQGLLSLDADITIQNRKIHSAGTIVIRKLEFSKDGGNFLGLPRLAVVKLLKDHNEQISLDFTIEGDLDNPKFSITEDLVQKVTLSLARTLGMPVESIGRSIFELGGSALKKLFQ